MSRKIVPNFILKDQDNNDLILYDNLNITIMLVFYPKVDTVICTKQLYDYNDNIEKFNCLGIKIVGISINEVGSHKKFSEKYNFTFLILNNKDKTVSKKYDALV